MQTWKNETVAEQEKRSPKEQPVLLSKDIETKLAVLDREVNYLLNKAKFAKPKSKAKAKNSTSSEKSSKANNSSEEEKVIPPTEDSTDTKSGGSHINTSLTKTIPTVKRLEITFTFFDVKKFQRRSCLVRLRPLIRPR